MPSALARSCKAHPRLFIATGTGIVVLLALPDSLGWLARSLIGWNVLAWGYVMLMAWMMARADTARVRAIAGQEDEGAVLVLAIICVAAAASFGAIVLELIARKHSGAPFGVFQYAIIASTVAGSWLLVGTVFSAHYARMFYTSPADKRPLRFPDGEANPRYGDFVYFAFTIACAAQTSDVSVMNHEMRIVVTAQTILGFTFNLAILGFSINVLAGVMSA